MSPATGIATSRFLANDWTPLTWLNTGDTTVVCDGTDVEDEDSAKIDDRALGWTGTNDTSCCWHCTTEMARGGTDDLSAVPHKYSHILHTLNTRTENNVWYPKC